MKPFNTRKLKILLKNARADLDKCEPKYRNHARERVQRLEYALFLAKQTSALARGRLAA